MRITTKLASIVLVLGAIVAGGSPAFATTSPEIPSDVKSAFDGAVKWIVADAAAYSDPGAEVFTKTTAVANITEVYTFTHDYLYGKPTKTAVTPTGEWYATVLSGSDVIGFVRVWSPEGGGTEVAGYAGQVDIGAALARAGGGTFVEEPRTAEVFLITGATIEPLNDAATVELPFPTSLSEFQKVISERILEADLAGEGLEAPVGGGGPFEDRRPWWYGASAWLILGVAALIASAAIFIGVALRRRASRA
jgi:hypothetical protein